MTDTVFITLLVLIVGVISPAILSFLTAYQRRKERKEEWEHQERAAKLVAAKVEEVAVATAETAKVIANQIEQVAIFVKNGQKESPQ